MLKTAENLNPNHEDKDVYKGQFKEFIGKSVDLEGLSMQVDANENGGIDVFMEEDGIGMQFEIGPTDIIRKAFFIGTDGGQMPMQKQSWNDYFNLAEDNFGHLI